MDDGTINVTMARRKLEIDMFSFQGEKRDLEKKREVIKADIARIKKEIDRLESEMIELQASVNHYDHRILDAESEVLRIKRKMNAL